LRHGAYKILHPRLLMLLLAALFTLSRASFADWLHREADIMGTRITVELFHTDPRIAEQGIESVMQEMRRIDAKMSPYLESSELAEINREAHHQPVKTSDELYGLIDRSIGFSALTQGAFDITFASVGFLYDYRRGKRPDQAQLQAAAGLINYQNLVMNAEAHTVGFTRPGVRIDLGGIAKGYAVDRCIQLLQAQGIRNALVTAGGDSRMIGDRWGRPWTIGVRDPRRTDGVLALLPLEDVAVSTSGDYERYFDDEGVRYHHIIDPQSGDSARELQSVTIIGPDATTTDALSTSVFVLGRERGLDLVNELQDIDAILVDSKGRLHYSLGLEAAGNMNDYVKTSTETRPAERP
jgi:thiamine biosynthesis lipoprotein